MKLLNCTEFQSFSVLHVSTQLNTTTFKNRFNFTNRLTPMVNVSPEFLINACASLDVR